MTSSQKPGKNVGVNNDDESAVNCNIVRLSSRPAHSSRRHGCIKFAEQGALDSVLRSYGNYLHGRCHVYDYRWIASLPTIPRSKPHAMVVVLARGTLCGCTGWLRVSVAVLPGSVSIGIGAGVGLRPGWGRFLADLAVRAWRPILTLGYLGRTRPPIRSRR